MTGSLLWDELEEVRQALYDLQVSLHVAQATASGPELDEAYAVLRALTSLREYVREVEQDWSEWVCDYRMPGRVTVIDGTTVEQQGGVDRSGWDHETLLKLLKARARDERRLDEETGEYEDPIDAYERALRECAGIGYWKVTGLRPRGIDPDEHAVTKPRRHAVNVPTKVRVDLAELEGSLVASLMPEAPERGLDGPLSRSNEDGVPEHPIEPF